LENSQNNRKFYKKLDLTLKTYLNLTKMFLGVRSTFTPFLQESIEEYFSFNLFECNFAPIHQKENDGYNGLIKDNCLLALPLWKNIVSNAKV
jgi:hypothetical protein